MARSRIFQMVLSEKEALGDPNTRQLSEGEQRNLLLHHVLLLPFSNEFRQLLTLLPLRHDRVT